MRPLLSTTRRPLRRDKREKGPPAVVGEEHGRDRRRECPYQAHGDREVHCLLSVLHVGEVLRLRHQAEMWRNDHSVQPVLLTRPIFGPSKDVAEPRRHDSPQVIRVQRASLLVCLLRVVDRYEIPTDRQREDTEGIRLACLYFLATGAGAVGWGILSSP